MLYAIIFSSLCLLPLTTFGAFKEAMLKGTFAAFHPQARHLSPAVGPSMLRIIQNIYHHGDPEHPITHLINDKKFGLYHALDDNIIPSRHLSFPAASLHPTLIAKIVAYSQLQTDSLRTSIHDDWKSAHKSILAAKGNPGNLKTERINGFLDTVVESLKATKDSRGYPYYYTVGILMHQLWERAETKNDLIAYIKEIHTLLGACKTTRTRFGRLSTSFFNNTHFEHAQQRDLDSNKYQIMHNDAVFEEQHALACLNGHNEKIAPRAVLNSSFGFHDGRPVQDCVEAAIRDISNILLYNNATFDLTAIPASLPIAPTLKAFYNTYATPSAIGTKASGQAWMNIVSNVEHGNYLRRSSNGFYELVPDAQNILTVLNTLYGTDATSYSQFASMLSTADRHIDVPFENEHKITFRITRKDQPSFDVHTCIDPERHAYVHVPIRSANENSTACHDKTHKQLVQLASNPETELKALILLSHHWATKNLPFPLKGSPTHITHSLLSSRIDNADAYEKLLYLCRNKEDCMPAYSDWILRINRKQIDALDKATQKTPLYLAISNGNTIMTEQLLKHGAQLHMPTHGISALKCAMLGTHAEIKKIVNRYIQQQILHT